MFHNKLAKKQMEGFSIFQARWTNKVTKVNCRTVVLLKLTSLNAQNSLKRMKTRTSLKMILTRASIQLLILV